VNKTLKLFRDKNIHALNQEYSNSLDMLEKKEKRKRRTALEIDRNYR
jgi:hypothetical protein